MPQYKLYYFDTEGGAGEPIRNAFNLAGIPFDDIRIPLSEWPSIKGSDKRYLYRQIPILEIDGKPFGQSIPILRYVGKLTGLYPTDPVEALYADEIMDCFMDMRGKLSVYFYLPKDVRGVARKNVVNKFMKPYYERIEDRVKGSKKRFAISDKLTIADLVMFNDITSPFYGADALDMSQLPALQKIIDNVREELGRVSQTSVVSKL